MSYSAIQDNYLKIRPQNTHTLTHVHAHACMRTVTSCTGSCMMNVLKIVVMHGCMDDYDVWLRTILCILYFW